MFQLIVVPLDGTSFAEHAVPTAIMLARAGGGRLLLVSVNVPLPAPVLAQEGFVTDQTTLQQIEAAARSYLDEVTRRVAAHAGVPVDSMLVSGSTPEDVLRDVSHSRGADLIVMTSHDRSALGRLFFGSVAEHVARAPGVPVLIVRKSDAQLDAQREADATVAIDPTRAPAVPFRHVLVPLDGSTVAEAVLAPATQLARATGATLTLLTVRDPLLAAAELPQHSAGQEYLERVARRLREEGLTVDTREADDRNVAHAITHGATDVAADVIAMATHGRGAVARFFQGDVMGGVLHRVLLPVLLVHPEVEARTSAEASSVPATGMPSA